MTSSPSSYQRIAKKVFDQEIRAIESTRSSINENFDEACKLLMNCKGKVILTGMGKSGHIARKIAATFASTGTPAFFVHPAEAQHGDLGMIDANDVVIAISYSGATPEILALLPHLVRFKIPLITLSQRKPSPLSAQAQVTLFVDIESKEACPLNLAPTSSTTASLVLGDALAVTLLESKGFREHDFAQFHPAGNLGKKLLLSVDELMHKGEALPCVPSEATVEAAILEVTKKRLGMTTICSPTQTLEGIFTDGDLRRTFEKHIDIRKTPIKTCMTKNPKTMHSGDLAVKAAQLMQEFKITALPVLDAHERIIGVVHLHDLFGHGVI